MLIVCVTAEEGAAFPDAVLGRCCDFCGKAVAVSPSANKLLKGNGGWSQIACPTCFFRDAEVRNGRKLD